MLFGVKIVLPIAGFADHIQGLTAITDPWDLLALPDFRALVRWLSTIIAEHVKCLTNNALRLAI